MNMSDKKKNILEPLHGGDLKLAVEEFGVKDEGWIDLSTGVNRNHYPNIDVSTTAATNLPSSNDNENLLESARKFYKVSVFSQIIAAPGTQLILQNIPPIFPNRKVAIFSPTYEEHRYTWEKAGNKVVPVSSLGALTEGAIGVVVNPNNPDGQTHQVGDLLAISEQLELLIIDEAFCDNVPELSAIPHLANGKILVLRSLGKFFGLAGLRLGFAIGPTQVTQMLIERLGPWAVSGPAIEVGNRALSDNIWISKMKEKLIEKNTRLNRILKKQNLSIIGGTELFTLVKTAQAPDIYKILGDKGILVRRFEEQKNWLRIGLPGIEIEWDRFELALNSNSNTINDMSE